MSKSQSTTESKELTVKDRLDRLERLIIKAIVNVPLSGPGDSKLVDYKCLPLAARPIIGRKYITGEPECVASNEEMYQDLQDILAGEIAAIQAEWDAQAAIEAEKITKRKRQDAQEQLQAAEQAAREAKLKLDALESNTPLNIPTA